MAVLKRVRKQHDEEGLQSEYVFLGQNRHGPVSPSTLEQFIGRISRDITLHGFRTTFKGWSIENGHSEENSEMALGHVVGNTVRNIYARYGQKIEPRRLMMQAWADYCDRTEALPADVLQFRKNNGTKGQ